MDERVINSKDFALKRYMIKTELDAKLFIFNVRNLHRCPRKIAKNKRTRREDLFFINSQWRLWNHAFVELRVFGIDGASPLSKLCRWSRTLFLGFAPIAKSIEGSIHRRSDVNLDRIEDVLREGLIDKCEAECKEVFSNDLHPIIVFRQSFKMNAFLLGTIQRGSSPVKMLCDDVLRIIFEEMVR